MIDDPFWGLSTLLGVEQMDKWNPLGDLIALQDRMNNLLKEALSSSGLANDQRGLSWSPPVDFFELEDSLVLIAELPGLAAQDIEINVEDNTLRLTGAREPKADQNHYYRRERSRGRFTREFNLPVAVRVNDIVAQLKQGVLEVVLPKSAREDGKPVKVTIKT